RAHRGDRRVAGSRALDRGAGPPLALARRRGFLALRRRAEPADAGSISAVFVRAGRGEEEPCARGSVRARDAGKLQDLVDLDAEVLDDRSEEHTSELQSLAYLVCRLLLEKNKRFVLCAGEECHFVYIHNLC